MGLSGIAAGLVVAVVVLALNAGLLGYVPEAADLPGLVGSITGVALVVTLTIGWLSREDRPKLETPPARPAILDRLPLEKRGALLALSVEDHYVRVQTSNGTELLLMRLSDAIRETGDLAGAQVHRSHWVAFPAVQTARRDGDRAVLTLKDGTEIPVSRANLPKLKEAGLLPR
nr:LytTR family DNA-binding domain-containing protein [Roseibaca sp. Y0-43]